MGIDLNNELLLKHWYFMDLSRQLLPTLSYMQSPTTCIKPWSVSWSNVHSRYDQVYFANFGMNFLWGDIFWIWWNPFHWQYVTNKCHTGLKGKGFLWFDFKVKYKLNPIQHLWTQSYHLGRKLRRNIVDYQGTSPWYDNRTFLHYELAEHRSQLKQPSGPSAECCFRDVNFFNNLLEVALRKVKAGEPYGSLHYLDFLTLSNGNESHTEILLSFQKSMIKQIIQISFVYLLFSSPAPS